MATDPSLLRSPEPSAGPAAARVGVFICDCGDNIAGIVDVDALADSTRELPDVAFAGRAPYWCSTDGRALLQRTVRSEKLDRVVVAGCSPRTHRNLFRATAQEVGLNPELVGVTNIREGCVWPHRAEPEAAARRACDQIRMEVAHTTALVPRIASLAQIEPAVLVIGGGVAGMTAALEIADAGVPATLVERTAALGGAATVDAPDLAAELAAAVESHEQIELRLESRVVALDGSVGTYRATIVSAAEPPVPTHFGAVIVASGAPDDDNEMLAAMLHLPRDEAGGLSEQRVRLRPDRYLERGIYVCGSAHYPCDASMAQFQAFSAASRALRHLRRGTVTLGGPAAGVDEALCNGCSDCYRTCPFTAITMLERPDGVSLSSIDPLLCTGCGNCVSICPVGAATLTGWSDEQLRRQMRAAVNGHPAAFTGASLAPGGAEGADALLPGGPGIQTGSQAHADGAHRILVFACEWSGHAALELAGAQRHALPADVRVIRLDCSGRLQAGLIFEAFEMGAAGVLILGCAPKLCHYERGNERAAAAYGQVESLGTLLGIDPARLRLAWAAPDDGPAMAELITEFAAGVHEAVGAQGAATF